MRTYIIISLLAFFVGNTYVTAQKELKLLSYNVLMGLQNDSVVKSKYVEWVKDINPDIVAYQEMNQFTQKSLEEFAQRYGHSYAVQSKIEGFPVALTSKYPIVNVRKVVDNMHHVYLCAKINGINFIVIHYSPFSYQKRQKEVHEVLACAALIPKNEKIAIMGDFNSLAEVDAGQYGPEMLDIRKQSELKQSHIRNLNNGQFDYSVTNAMIEAGYTDAVKKYHKEFIYSIPSKKYRKNNHLSRIDYVWTNAPLTKLLKSATIIHDEATEEMSDHYPLLITFDND